MDTQLADAECGTLSDLDIVSDDKPDGCVIGLVMGDQSELARFFPQFTEANSGVFARPLAAALRTGEGGHKNIHAGVKFLEGEGGDTKLHELPPCRLSLL